MDLGPKRSGMSACKHNVLISPLLTRTTREPGWSQGLVWWVIAVPVPHQSCWHLWSHVSTLLPLKAQFLALSSLPAQILLSIRSYLKSTSKVFPHYPKLCMLYPPPLNACGIWGTMCFTHSLLRWISGGQSSAGAGAQGWECVSGWTGCPVTFSSYLPVHMWIFLLVSYSLLSGHEDENCLRRMRF